MRIYNYSEIGNTKKKYPPQIKKKQNEKTTKKN